MFEDLNAALNCDASNPPAQGLTLIKCAALTGEGSLLIHHFLSLYLQVPLLCDCGKHNQHAVEKEIGLLAVVMCSDHVYPTMFRGKICARTSICRLDMPYVCAGSSKTWLTMRLSRSGWASASLLKPKQ